MNSKWCNIDDAPSLVPHTIIEAPQTELLLSLSLNPNHTYWKGGRWSFYYTARLVQITKGNGWFEVPWCWIGREKVWAQSYGKSKGSFSKNKSSDSEKDQLGGTDLLASISSPRVLTTFAERGKGHGIRQPTSSLHWEPVHLVLPPRPHSLIQDWWYLKFLVCSFICTNSSSPQA